ncbi:SCP-2 sterol transfer family protein [Mycobacterium sp. TNTM28]|uniref:SCP-2 sterol transfer family protein n=1 Tax=[Mycobacterium] fortunisiensis TaxID=2600579 RepID=A0ABS6KMU4_9MYCO|nr:SCP-2 sterol transfer family protein [[Mycobacterium] fortunisiensis]MBU9764824.1 SCP-2 sterol transfer family protein [[Mycobacterium] fortunisiensis]
MAERVSSLLRRSIEHLADEGPAGYRLVADRLGPLVVEIDVDHEIFCLSGGDALKVLDGPAAAGVRICTSRAAILEILDARVQLADAVETDLLCVRGTLDAVLRAHDTLLAYVHAVVRSPAHPDLLAALRTETP